MGWKQVQPDGVFAIVAKCRGIPVPADVLRDEAAKARCLMLEHGAKEEAVVGYMAAVVERWEDVYGREGA